METTTGRGHPVSDTGLQKMRAADADRDRVAEILGTAYSEGRLSKDEYDARLDNAFAAHTYADLDQVIADLPARTSPAGEMSTMSPEGTTNAFAIASLVCAFAQVMFGPLATILAIVLGYIARSQIKRTGERGAGLALAGLILGWAALILGIALFVVGLVLSKGMHGT